MKAQAHPQQDMRLDALRGYDILDTEKEKAFDDIAVLVAAICDAPIGVVNFIDADRQWFKAETGLGIRSTPLDTSLCSHVILEGEFVEIPDTLNDPRMADNPLCTAEEGALRFYAGATLRTQDDLPLGTLCVLDDKPRTLSPLQREAVKVLAARVMSELDLRVALKRERLLRREVDHRTKNGIAAITAILALEERATKDDAVRQALQSVRQRLGSLAALHQELHDSPDGKTVDLSRYLSTVVEQISELLPSRVNVSLSADRIEIASERAAALAILVNEFVANSIKHAFPEPRPGDIRISCEEKDGAIHVHCSDDGVGDPVSLDALAARRGLGGRIITATTGQLGGTAEWSCCNPGLSLEVTIPADR